VIIACLEMQYLRIVSIPCVWRGFHCNSTGCGDYTLNPFLEWVEKEHGECKNLWKFNFINPEYEQPLADEWVEKYQNVMRRTEERFFSMR
jgi:hypothetical protein